MRDFGKALEGYEDIPQVDHNLSSRLWETLNQKILAILQTELSTGTYQEYDRERHNIQRVLEVFWPNIDKDVPTGIAIWPTVESRLKGRSGRTYMKHGRSLRKMFPVLTDAEIESLVDQVKEEILPIEYTYKSSKEASAMVHAYCGPKVRYGNLTTTFSKKHLSTSCMRYDFEDLPKHPVEAYASGDFTIHWLESSDGKVGARCLEYNGVYGPIYAACEQSYRSFEELAGINHEDVGNGNWIGARLKAFPIDECGDEGFIGPYLDLTPQLLTHDAENGFLVISRDGDIDGSQYSGTLSYSDACPCAQCGTRLHEDELCYFHDEHYCESCHSEIAIYCEHCCDFEPRESSHIVYREMRFGPNSETWCEYCTEENAIECVDGKSWHIEDVVFSAYDEALDPQTFEQDYFRSDDDCEVYPNCELALFSDGTSWTLVQVSDFNATHEQTKAVYDEDSGSWVFEKVREEEQASA